MKKTARKELALLIKFFLEGTDYGKKDGKTPVSVTGIEYLCITCQALSLPKELASCLVGL